MAGGDSLIALAGMPTGVVAVAIGSVSAQATKSGIEARTKDAAKKTQAEWQSLSPEEQQKFRDQWKVDAEKAQAKWNSLTPEQQDAEKQKVTAAAKKGQQKWQVLPK